ncbi:MAG: TAT-variant-translocated molybdopterin oxidoreductase, partial [Planctomycetota bacterium]
MTTTITPKTRISPYWRSLDDLEGSPEFQKFLQKEFPQQAEDFPEGVSRRRWMQIMGASFALAGVQGCRWQTEKIVPFAERPDGYVPGTSTKFATSIEWAGNSKHLLVTCYDGRPIKVEGNPEHPYSRGGADAFAQAATLSLYDPDRQATVFRRDLSRPGVAGKSASNWIDFERFLSEQVARLSKAGGAGLGVLMPPSSSQTIASLLVKLGKAMPKARFYQYAAVSRDSELAG